MNIRILTVGKPENSEYRKLVDMYYQRLGHYTRIDMDFIKPEKIKQDNKEIIKREEQRIKQKLDTQGLLIALDKSGKMMSSTQFADWFGKQQLQSTPSATFVIGGPLGFSPEFLKSANMTLSFSPMTLAHELAAVVLLEQIYRAHTILRGEKYHK